MISRTPLLLGIASVLLIPALVLAEPTIGTPVQGHGGNGGNRGRVLNDIELTAITRADETNMPLNNALIKARADLVKASLTLPSNTSEIALRTQEIAKAELALALNRVETFAKLKTQLNATTEPRLTILKNALTSPTAGGAAPRGGRGGAAPAAAPGAAGAPGAAAMPAAPGRGN